MTYLLRINDRYYYNRQVPPEVRLFDPRDKVRFSLKTDSKEEAKRRSIVFNEQVEAYWRNLIAKGETHKQKEFKKTVDIARQLGFSYQPMSIVATLPIIELLQRVLLLKDNPQPAHVEAVLGGKPEPEIDVLAALNQYWDLAKDKIINKTDYQIQKWKNPRRKATENFVVLRGNKNILSITRDDIIAFRDWWLDRINNENKDVDSANKNLRHLKAVMETVSDHHNLKIDIDYLFKKVLLKNCTKRTRKPFTSEQIISILKSEKLNNTHPECKLFLMAMTETGARPSELLGLDAKNIHLDVEIPYISIVGEKKNKKSLKTHQSERDIPLVGYALEAFKQIPNGFSHYKNLSDNLTTALNKFLRDNKLVTDGKQSIYSLRHSFQDRILSVNVPDRVQAELMGHKFSRPLYGDGGSLKQKREWLDKACLKK